MDGGRIRAARLALGGVAHKPWRLTAAEAALRGASLDDSNALKSAIAKSFADARPLAHNAFKVELAQRAALRALQTAGARTCTPSYNRSRASTADVAALVIDGRCRQGNCGRRSEGRGHLHDARSPSQRDGAARDPGGLGRRRSADSL